MAEKSDYQSAMLYVKEQAQNAVLFKGKKIDFYNKVVEMFKLDVPMIDKK